MATNRANCAGTFQTDATTAGPAPGIAELRLQGYNRVFQPAVSDVPAA
jgi:hypothetical protein